MKIQREIKLAEIQRVIETTPRLSPLSRSTAHPTTITIAGVQAQNSLSASGGIQIQIKYKHETAVVHQVGGNEEFDQDGDLQPSHFQFKLFLSAAKIRMVMNQTHSPRENV